MRAFIAIPLPKEIKKLLSCLQEELKASGADIKWVEPQNIHLTLKFLGEITREQADKIALILEDTAGSFGAFNSRISGAGAFPRITSARVIWAGIDEGDKEIRQIAAALEEKIAALGIPKEERKFSSHITLGRSRSGRNLAILAKLLQGMGVLKEGQRQEFRVDRITLFKSTLSPKGPTYEPLKEASLKTT